MGGRSTAAAAAASHPAWGRAGLEGGLELVDTPRRVQPRFAGGVEFFGHQGSQAGGGPLAHFKVLDDNRDDAVTVDFHKGIKAGAIDTGAAEGDGSGGI